MPILDSIDRRISKDPVWKKATESARGTSRDTALRMPLVHVTPYRYPFEQILGEQSRSIPLSDTPGYVSDAARTREEDFGIKPCVYFYPGRSGGVYGPVAFAFDPSIEDEQTGSVTLTGYYGDDDRTELPCNSREPFKNVTVREDYFTKSTMPADDLTDVPPWPNRLRANWFYQMFLGILGIFRRKPRQPVRHWRAVFAKYLEAYFPTIRDYWFGEPFRDDPDDIFTVFRSTDEPTWYVWTPEVRLDEPVPLDAAAAWCPRPQRWWNTVVSVLDDQEMPESVERFCTETPALVPSGSRDYTGLVDRWCMDQCLTGG